MEKNAYVNGLASFIIPGAGHIINGEAKRGVAFLAVMVLLHYLIYFFLNNPVGSGISTLYHLYAGYDAYRLTKIPEI